MLAKSYSSGISLGLVLRFFIKISLTARGEARAYNSYGAPLLGVNHHQDTAQVRHSYGDEPWVVRRGAVGERVRKHIVQYSRCFAEIDPCFLRFAVAFLGSQLKTTASV
jgi:hypothetical protein